MTPTKLKGLLKKAKKSAYDFACITAQGGRGKNYITTTTIYNFINGHKVSDTTMAKIVMGAKKL